MNLNLCSLLLRVHSASSPHHPSGSDGLSSSEPCLGPGVFGKTGDSGISSDPKHSVPLAVWTSSKAASRDSLNLYHLGQTHTHTPLSSKISFLIQTKSFLSFYSCFQ